MGIAVAHHPIAIHRVLLCPLIARDDTGGHPHATHGNDKAAGNVFTKALFFIKPKFISAVLAIQPRRECVAVIAFVQSGQQVLGKLLRQLGFIGLGLLRLRPLPPSLRPGHGARVAACGQAGQLLLLPLTQLQVIAVLHLAAGAVAQQIAGGAAHQQLQIGALPHGAFGQILHGDGVFQRHQPRAVRGFQRHGIAVYRTAALHPALQLRAQLPPSRALLQGAAVHLPLLPIKICQHRATKIQGAFRRRLAIKLKAKGDALIQRQLRHLPHLHTVRQACFARRLIARYAPQGRKARKQHKQRRHDGRAQQHQPPSGFDGHRQRWPARRHMRINHRCQQPPQPQQHGQRQRQTLPK